MPLVEVMEQVCNLNEQPTSNSEVMLSYFKKLLVNTTQLPMLDLSFFSVYEPSFGFRIQFNVLQGAKAQDSVYSTIVSIAPPASLYNTKNKSMF